MGADEPCWPHRPTLKVTATEKFTHPPDPTIFPGTFPLDFIQDTTGYAVRSVSPEDFANMWRSEFHKILATKGAGAEHDDFWSTGTSQGC